jgi:GT2 family glycosyltransferase
MDDLFVAVPWRTRGDPYREKSLRYVRNHLKSITGIDPTLVDGNKDEFSLSAARNVGVKKAKESGKSIVVICDADTIVEPDAILNSIELARKSKHVILPYTICKPLTIKSTNLYYEGHDVKDLREAGNFDWSTGGVYVSSVSAWEYLGGQDERFTNWGCEDTAFNLASQKMNRPLQRVDGTIYPLWHQSYAREEDEWYIYNSNLLKWYSESSRRRIRKMIKNKMKGKL